MDGGEKDLRGRIVFWGGGEAFFLLLLLAASRVFARKDRTSVLGDPFACVSVSGDVPWKSAPTSS